MKRSRSKRAEGADGDLSAAGLVIHDWKEEKLDGLTKRTPVNAEFGLSSLLGSGFLTSPEIFVIRNHTDRIPDFRQEEKPYVLEIERGEELSRVELSCGGHLIGVPDSLVKSKVVTIECAGNRRKEANAVAKIEQATLWRDASIGNALWSGYDLHALLSRLFGRAYSSGYDHVVFSAGDSSTLGDAQEWDRFVNDEVLSPRDPHRIRIVDGRSAYETSVPIGMARQVILANRMNGEALPKIHGYPLRAIVPGYIGARSVKWLQKVRLSRIPSLGYYHRIDYVSYVPRSLRPGDAPNITAIMKSVIGSYRRAVRRGERGATTLGRVISSLHSRAFQGGVGPAVHELNPQSAIMYPPPGAKVASTGLTIRGYAICHRAIRGVEIRTDGGAWEGTYCYQDNSRVARKSNIRMKYPHAWVLWRSTKRDLPRGPHTVEVRVVVSNPRTGERMTQSEDVMRWNVRGVFHNVPHTVAFSCS